MKSKQVLSIEQMQHLQELGLELDYNTILSWIVDDREKDKPLLCISSEAVDYVDFSHYCLPAYTLQDILEILPSTIGEGEDYCYLEITAHGKGESRGYVIQYHNPEEDCDYNIAMDKELIEAAYQELLICIEGNSVNTRKEKQQ